MEIKPKVDYNFTAKQGEKLANIVQPPIVLSILIATMPSRKLKFETLLSEIMRQVTMEGVEYIINHDIQHPNLPHIPLNIGTKRNLLLAESTGKYVVFIDDDDHISPDYVSKILTACQSDADCIGISGIITTNGTDRRQWHISKDYGSWYTGQDGTYYRTPNHISPVKRELALQAGFPEISFGEDFEYSRRLLPLLKSETKVEGNIYYYDYWNTK